MLGSGSLKQWWNIARMSWLPATTAVRWSPSLESVLVRPRLPRQKPARFLHLRSVEERKTDIVTRLTVRSCRGLWSDPAKSEWDGGLKSPKNPVIAAGRMSVLAGRPTGAVRTWRAAVRRFVALELRARYVSENIAGWWPAAVGLRRCAPRMATVVTARAWAREYGSGARSSRT